MFIIMAAPNYQVVVPGGWYGGIQVRPSGKFGVMDRDGDRFPTKFPEAPFF